MATSDSPQPTGSVWHDWVLLTRFDKPIGSYLLLWPTLWALWAAAEGVPDWKNLLIFIAGVFVMRSAGCVINDYADREIDRHVARTRDRPLTQGRITEKAALTGFAILCLMAFGLVLMVVALVALIRNDLLASWQQQLPQSAPNYFAINIQPYEREAFAGRLDQAEVKRSPLYPIVRGRLTEINSQPARDAVPEKAKEDNALHRELNLTWRADLPDDNQVITGRWWGESYQVGSEGLIPLSLESGMAERLSLGMGDTLSFDLAGQTITGEVTNIRQVNWDNFQPNFYVITPPGVLEQMPQTLLASFYLSEQQKHMVPGLVKSFPAVSLLDISQILEQVRQILEQVTLAIEVMLGFTLLSGLVLLLAAVKNSLDERLREGALYRTLGASGTMIRSIQRYEFVLLGIVAGLLALMGSELTAYLLYRNLFDLDYSLSFTHWLVLPISGAVIITLAGLWGTRFVVKQPPLQVLRAG